MQQMSVSKLSPIGPQRQRADRFLYFLFFFYFYFFPPRTEQTDERRDKWPRIDLHFIDDLVPAGRGPALSGGAEQRSAGRGRQSPRHAPPPLGPLEPLGAPRSGFVAHKASSATAKARAEEEVH